MLNCNCPAGRRSDLRTFFKSDHLSPDAAVEGVAEVEEPGERSGAAGERGGLANLTPREVENYGPGQETIVRKHIVLRYSIPTSRIPERPREPEGPGNCTLPRNAGFQAVRVATIFPVKQILSIPQARGYRRGAAAMTDRTDEGSQDDLRDLVRVISASLYVPV